MKSELWIFVAAVGVERDCRGSGCEKRQFAPTADIEPGTISKVEAAALSRTVRRSRYGFDEIRIVRRDRQTVAPV